MRAIVIQCAPGTDKAANIGMLAHLMHSAVGDGPLALVSLPEMWSCLGGSRLEKLAQSEILPPPGSQEGAGPAFRFLSDTARRMGVVLHGGSIGERSGEMLFNTTLVFGPDGEELSRYRKIHLFDVTTPSGQGYRESSLFNAGTEPVLCALPGDAGLNLGLTICYDLRFPDLFSHLRSLGADVILVPSAFTVETGRDHWEVLLRARAIETQCWIVAAATTGTHADAAGRPRTTYGHSMIVDPWGTIVAQLADQPGHAEATIDRGVTARIREAMPVLAHRRLA